MGDAREQLLTAIHDFGDDRVRDAWLFDQSSRERLYARDDVSAILADLDVEKLIDNERYGYITDDTYESLYGTEYCYTVRGLATHTLFRTFFEQDDQRIGLLVGLDPNDTAYDFDQFAREVHEAVANVPIDVLRPQSED